MVAQWYMEKCAHNYRKFDAVHGCVAMARPSIVISPPFSLGT